MSVSTSPPPGPPKKSNKGCCGCGCGFLLLLVGLFVSLSAAVGYLGYTNTLKLTTTTPATIPSYDGGDDVYDTTEQKLNGFTHDAQNHLAATIQLSADEINTLIAHDPDFAKNNIQLYISFTNDVARAQISLPTALFSSNMLKDRYLYGDFTFGVYFDPDAKTLNFDLKNLQFGSVVAPKDDLAIIQNLANAALNRMLSNDPQFKGVLDQAASIQIKDGLLFIATK